MDPTIYQREDHSIALENVDPDAVRCVAALQKAGHAAYIVGGGVRDLLLGQHPKDYDISTSAKPEEVKSLFRGQCLLIGRRFRLAHIRYGKKVMEVATFRAGSTETDQLIVRDNEWGTAEEDALRRDFTINGLFYDPTSQVVIDYVNGYPDIQKNYLRTIGQPFLRFKQDPVRMIRLLKFQARFGFEIDPDAKVALAECRPDILKSSQARILEEILRMLESGKGQPFMRLMNEHGFLEHLLPPLGELLEKPEGADIYAFLQEVDSRIESRFDRALLLSCLTFPFLTNHLQTHFLSRGKNPHLGDIQQEAYDVISTIFQPFFVLPRRLRMKMVSIMTSQYRMTPFERRARRKIRIPRDPEFSLSLEFLDLRQSLEPALATTWKEWHETYQNFTRKRNHG